VLLARGVGEAASLQFGPALAIMTALAIYCYGYALRGEQGLLLALSLETIFAAGTKPHARSGPRAPAPRAAVDDSNRSGVTAELRRARSGRL
jgi:hypothetical protein